MSDKEQLQSLITELKRGSLTLAVLGSLKQPYYGYALLQTLQSQNIEIEANTLYPLLRRLESQGLLISDWDTSESRPRKYYTVSLREKRSTLRCGRNGNGCRQASRPSAERMNRMDNLIERYVYDVTRRLPEQERGEVGKELKSNIYDMLSDDADEAEIRTVLYELARPPRWRRNTGKSRGI
jgi:predicted transcriptional regulator